MAKVKKGTGVTGERNSKGKAERRKTKGTTRTDRTRSGSQPAPRTGSARKAKSTQKTKRKKRGKSASKRIGQALRTKRGAGRGLTVVRGRAARDPVIRVAVRPLDPLRKCGPNTTVQLLFRVDEEVDGRTTPHLVFFDRHGWYCEHGRSCPAVGHARKFNGQIARVS